MTSGLEGWLCELRVIIVKTPELECKSTPLCGCTCNPSTGRGWDRNITGVGLASQGRIWGLEFHMLMSCHVGAQRWNPDPLQEQQMLFTTEPPLQPRNSGLHTCIARDLPTELSSSSLDWILNVTGPSSSSLTEAQTVLKQVVQFTSFYRLTGNTIINTWDNQCIQKTGLLGAHSLGGLSPWLIDPITLKPVLRS